MFPVVPSNRTPLQPQPQTQAAAEGNADGGEEPPAPLRREGSRKAKEIQESACELTSIKDLRKRIRTKEHQGTSLASFFFLSDTIVLTWSLEACMKSLKDMYLSE